MAKNLKNLFQLDGKIIVVTGAAGLLGSQFTEAIVAFGGIPVLIDLNKRNISKLADYIKEKYKISIHGFDVDITNESAVQNNADDLIERYGKIDGI